MEYISHEDYKKMLTGFGKELPKAKLNEGLEKEGNAFTAGLAKTKKGGEFKVGDKEFKDKTNYDASVSEDEMEEGNAFTAGLAKTKKGGEFKVGDKSFKDRTNYDAPMGEDDISKDTSGAAYHIGDKVNYQGHSFTIMIGAGGTVVLKHSSGRMIPNEQSMEILKQAAIDKKFGSVDEYQFDQMYPDDPGPFEGKNYMNPDEPDFAIAVGEDLESSDLTPEQLKAALEYLENNSYDLQGDFANSHEVGGGSNKAARYIVGLIKQKNQNMDSAVKEFLAKEDDVNWDRMDDEEAEENETDNGIEEYQKWVNGERVEEEDDSISSAPKDYIGTTFMNQRDLERKAPEVKIDWDMDDYHNAPIIKGKPSIMEPVIDYYEFFGQDQYNRYWTCLVDTHDEDGKIEDIERAPDYDEDEMEEGINLPSSQPTGPSIQEKRSRLAHLTSEERDQLKQYVETIKTVKEEIKKMVGKKDMEEGGDNTNLIMQPTTVSEEGGGEHDEIESNLDPKIHDAFHKVAGMAVKSLIKAGIEPDQIKAFFQHEISELPDFVSSQYEGRSDSMKKNPFLEPTLKSYQDGTYKKDMKKVDDITATMEKFYKKYYPNTPRSEWNLVQMIDHPKFKG